MMYGWSPQSTDIFVHLNRRWDVQTIWKCMQNRSKWHVPWMRMFCHCFPFIVFTVPKDQRGEVGTSFQIVSSASEPVIFFTNRNTKIWTGWPIPLVILVGVSSNKSKQGVHPKSIGTVCFIPGQTHLATHVPSFTSRSSEILLWCLFNIATWEKKKSGCSGWTNRTQWCETASWKFQATVAGLHMASHVPCDLKIWLQMHGIPVQACPWNFESWSWLGGLGRWEQKNVLIFRFVTKDFRFSWIQWSCDLIPPGSASERLHAPASHHRSWSSWDPPPQPWLNWPNDVKNR